MGWTSLHTAARDGDMKRMTRVMEINWLEPVDVNAQSLFLPDLIPNPGFQR